MIDVWFNFPKLVNTCSNFAVMIHTTPSLWSWSKSFFSSKQWFSTHKSILCTSKIHVYDVLHAQYATIGVFLWSCNPGPLLEELALDSLELTILRYFYAWMYWSMYCRLKESLSTTIHCAPKPAAWRPF
jgi:hypothetical protein